MPKTNLPSNVNNIVANSQNKVLRNFVDNSMMRVPPQIWNKAGGLQMRQRALDTAQRARNFLGKETGMTPSLSKAKKAFTKMQKGRKTGKK